MLFFGGVGSAKDEKEGLEKEKKLGMKDKRNKESKERSKINEKQNKADV